MILEIAYEYPVTVVTNENTDMVHCKGDFGWDAVVRWRGRSWREIESGDEIDFAEVCLEMGMDPDDHEAWLDACSTIFRWAEKHDAMILECSTL